MSEQGDDRCFEFKMPDDLARSPVVCRPNGDLQRTLELL